MAKVPADIHFSGTIGDICYYQWKGQTFARAKSSLTREKVLKSKTFKKTMQFAGSFTIASRIGSAVYKALPTDVKGRWLYRAIAGEAASLLYSGKSEQQVKDALWKKYITGTECADKETIKANKGVNTTRSTKKANRQLKTLFLFQWEKQGKPKRYFERAWTPGERFTPDTIPRRAEYFLGLRHALRMDEI